MRILYVAPMNSIHAARWVGYFTRAGLDVHVVNVGTDDHTRIRGAVYHDGLSRPDVEGGLMQQFLYGYRPFRRGMMDLLSRSHPDIVHVHGINIYACIVKCCGFRPVVATAWGSEVLVKPRLSIKYHLIVRLALSMVDQITCDGENSRRRMIELGASPSAIEIIYFGTDVERFRPGQRDRGLGEELRFSPETRLVISLRSLWPIYDVATLIRAIPDVLRVSRKTGFVVVGEGPERPTLERLASELGVTAYIRFVGRLSSADVERYVASCDIYVSTALSDAGLAVSTAEAMASGVPPVVSDFGDNGDWIENGVTGYLFPLGDETVLAERIIQLLGDPEARRAIGLRARQAIEQRSNWRDEMTKAMRLYEQVASNRAAV